MAEILTPNCPVCGAEPAIALAGFAQWFCGNGDCNILMWSPSKSLDENLMDAGFVRLQPEDGTDA